MRMIPVLMAVFIGYGHADRVRVDLPEGPVQSYPDVLLYHDGTPQWLTWAGVYRGTWFRFADFPSSGGPYYLSEMEWWMFEHPSYPWDTSAFYAEIWEGDSNGPMVLLDQQLVYAVHNTPVYTYYDPPLVTEDCFWAIANTEMSSGGWPSMLADGTGYGTWPPECRSFFSEDLVIWEPWSSPAPDPYGDFLLCAYGEYSFSINPTTWGFLKALF